MGVLGKIFGVGKGVQGVTAVGNVLDKLFTSKDEKLTHEEVRMRLMMQPDVAQVELNKVEASHRSTFVAGWRPFIGWVCGVALAYNFIVRDIVAWALSYYNPVVRNAEGLITSGMEAPPELAMEHLLTVLLGMLGLGGLRTYEKIKGKSK